MRKMDEHYRGYYILRVYTQFLIFWSEEEAKFYAPIDKCDSLDAAKKTIDDWMDAR